MTLIKLNKKPKQKDYGMGIALPSSQFFRYFKNIDIKFYSYEDILYAKKEDKEKAKMFMDELLKKLKVKI